MKDNKVAKDFIKSLSSDYQQQVMEVATSSIFSSIDATVFMGVPILSAVYSLWQLHSSYFDYHRIRKLAIFITEIENNNESKKLEKYKKAILEKGKSFEEDLDFMLIIIDRIIEDSKAKYLAKIYKAYLDRAIDMEEFKVLSISLSSLLESDIERLKEFPVILEKFSLVGSDSVARLQSAGFIIEHEDEIKVPSTIQSIRIPVKTVVNYDRTPIGEKFVKCISEY